MFGIVFENERYKQWSCEFVFNNFADAKEYLINQGFIENNRVFESGNGKWSKYKAYITPRKVWIK